VIHTFFKSELLSVHLVLLNFMCLHDMLGGSLEPIKFDIEFMEPYAFSKIFTLIFLILKCLVQYLGLSLIIIFL